MILGTVWSGFCQWALVIVLAKLGTIEMVGMFTLSVAISLPMLMFGCLNLRSIYVTDRNNIYRFSDYLSLRLVMAAACVGLTMSAGLISGYSGQLIVVIMVVTASKALEYISDMLYGPMQKRERMSPIAISMMIRGTLSITCMAIAMFITRSLLWGSAGLFLASAIVLLAYDIPISLRLADIRLKRAFEEYMSSMRSIVIGGRARWRQLGMLAFTGVPLGLVLMLVSLNVNIPRYFVERNLGLREQGIFSSIANLVSAGTVAIGAIGQCAMPRLSQYFADGKKSDFINLLRALVLASLGFGAAGLVVAVGAGRQVLAILYRPEYASRQDVFVWLAAASGPLYLGSSMGVAVTAVRCFTPQLPLFLVSVLVTAAACFFLIPVIGLRGAALALGLSAFIQSCGGALLLRAAFRSQERTPVF